MKTKVFLASIILATAVVTPLHAVTLWRVGIDNNNQLYTPANPGDGTGGEQANFVQEAGPSNPLPGNPANTGGTGATRDIDDDYYFAGIYSTVQDGGSYTPVNIVPANEQNVERAFTGGDGDLRFHFNIPATVSSTDLLSISFDFYNMDRGDSDPVTAGNQPYPDNVLFWDVEVSMNGVSLFTTQITRDIMLNQLNTGNVVLTTPTFTLADVNGATGAGPDNYVTLRGTNSGSQSRWMSLDYVQFDANPIPEPSSLGFLAIAASALVLIRRRRS